ncbi:MAG: hypothetical protein RIS79_1774, partial [Verrucomicrobiota bacterium]
MKNDLKKDLFAFAEKHRGECSIAEMLPIWLKGGASSTDRIERLNVWMESLGTDD